MIWHSVIRTEDAGSELLKLKLLDELCEVFVELSGQVEGRMGPGSKSIVVALGLCICSVNFASTNFALAGTVSSVRTEATNDTSLLNPCYQPLPEGAGPQTNDVTSKRILKQDIPSFSTAGYQPLPENAGPQTNDVTSKRILKQDIPSFNKVRTEDSKETKEELADLWDAALVNSQDVRFIVERMAPKKENIKSGGMIEESVRLCMVASWQERAWSKA